MAGFFLPGSADGGFSESVAIFLSIRGWYFGQFHLEGLFRQPIFAALKFII